MAKAGEGDERWIVDDLGSQGTNVSFVWPDMQIIFRRSSQIRLIAFMLYTTPYIPGVYMKRINTIHFAL